MRILLVCHKPPFPAADGGTQDSASLSRALHDVGHDVHVLAMAKNTSTALVCDERTGIPQELVRVDSSFRLVSSLASALRGQPSSAARFRSHAFASRLRRRVETEAFDVVQVDGIATGQYSEIIRASSRACFILRAHNDESDLWAQRATTHSGFPRWYLRHEARLVRFAERSLWRSADGVAAISHDVATDGSREKSSHVVFAPTPQEIAPEPAPLNHDVFHIGSPEWWPNKIGLEWFLNMVWPAVRAAYPAAIFHIAGRGSREFVEAHPTAQTVADGDVRDATDYICARGVLIVPNLQGSGLSIKLCQGMAQGKAIVSTKLGLRGLERDGLTPAVLSDDSAEAFARHLMSLLSSRELTDRVGRAGWAYAKSHFEPRMIGHRLSEFYDSIRVRH